MDLIGNVGTSAPRVTLKTFSNDLTNFSAHIELGDRLRPYIVYFEEDGYYCISKGYKILTEASEVAEKYIQTGEL